jgi:hypothetical protein
VVYQVREGARWGTPTSATVPLSFKQLGVFSDHQLHYFPFKLTYFVRLSLA